MASKGNIAVLGAGVIGLTNSVILRQAGYNVLIIASHLPGDTSIEYASPWAGAQWRTHATSTEPTLCDWDVQTYEYWVDLMTKEAVDSGLPTAGLKVLFQTPPRAVLCPKLTGGVKMYESHVYWDRPVVEDLWWASHVIDFKWLSPSQEPICSINERGPLKGVPILAGAACRAMTINVPHYLLYLQEKARMLGVEIIRADLPTGTGFNKALEAAQAIATKAGMLSVDCFVNNTGIGARKLCGDEKVFPSRGQTVLVKGEASMVRTRIGDGYSAYCIPRPGSGTTILGGTREEGNWSGAVDSQTTNAILKRCSQIAPELQTGVGGQFEVISVQCGLRPSREGGPRMERETVGGRRVVHAYGHAGAGYQNSIGSARWTLKMVGDSMGLADTKL